LFNARFALFCDLSFCVVEHVARQAFGALCARLPGVTCIAWGISSLNVPWQHWNLFLELKRIAVHDISLANNALGRLDFVSVCSDN
jgi:hypothetical protein